MRNCDRSPHHQCDVESVQKFVAVYADAHTLLDVISDAVVATQHGGGYETEQLLGSFVECSVFISLRVEGEEALDPQVTAAQEFFIHLRTITIKFIHSQCPFRATARLWTKYCV